MSFQLNSSIPCEYKRMKSVQVVNLSLTTIIKQDELKDSKLRNFNVANEFDIIYEVY